MTVHSLEEEILLSYLSSLTLSDNTSVKGWYTITEYVSSKEEKNSHKQNCSYVEVWSLGLGLFSCNSLCTQHGINTAGLKIVTVTTKPPWMQSQYWKQWKKSLWDLLCTCSAWENQVYVYILVTWLWTPKWKIHSPSSICTACDDWCVWQNTWVMVLTVISAAGAIIIISSKWHRAESDPKQSIAFTQNHLHSKISGTVRSVLMASRNRNDLHVTLVYLVFRA